MSSALGSPDTLMPHHTIHFSISVVVSSATARNAFRRVAAADAETDGRRERDRVRIPITPFRLSSRKRRRRRSRTIATRVVYVYVHFAHISMTLRGGGGRDGLRLDAPCVKPEICKTLLPLPAAADAAAAADTAEVDT